VVLGRPEALKWKVGNLVQMQVKPVRLALPTKDYFPMVRTNTTGHALFEELRACVLSKDEHLVVDAENNEIRVRRRFLAGPLNFVKGMFGIR
jgi:hypothetical protein